MILVQETVGTSVSNSVYLGSTMVPFRNNATTSPDGGATLDGSGSSYTYRASDGTEIEFGDPTGNIDDDTNLCNGTGQANCSLLPLSVTSPDGKTVGIDWDVASHCTLSGGCIYYTRIAGLSNSLGSRITFSYSGGVGSNGIPTSGWFLRSGAAFYNDNVSTTTAQASVSYSYPSAGVTQVTDTAGRVWRFTGDAQKVTAIRRPGASSDTTTIAYGTGNVVTSVTDAGVTTNYARSVSGSTATMTVTNALSQVSTVVSDLTLGRPTSVTDALSRTTSYQYDTAGRLTRTTAPEGNYVAYTYDARGNVTQTQAVAKSGSGAATITTSASYDSTCSNPVTCNSPNSVTDARGNTTDYSYDATHGGVVSVTAPAAPNGVRPQTRYSYTLTNGEYQLTGTSTCRTGSAPSCVGTSDEVKSSLAYDSSGNVTSTSTSDGTGTLTATNAMTYDPMGNLLTVDGPLAGTADTTRFRYNAARELVGTISPDPDGSGALKHRAARTTINATTGLPTKVEQGTVNSQSDSDWAAFAPLQRVETLYDVNFRPFRQKLVDPATGTIHAVTDTSYDALGRVECVAQRMNQAAFATGAFADTACSPDSGSFGPDRIVKTIYDAAGQATKVTSAFGVAGEQTDDVTATYTANGQLETLTDAENNKTTYVYDGHDRLYRTLYPSATKGAGTSNRPTMSRTPTTPTATLRRSATGRTRRSATATTR